VPTRDEWRHGFGEPDPADEDPRTTPQPEPGKAGFEGTDDQGVITVLVDGSGAVADVVVPSDWKARIAPHELGDALRTAANNAFFGWLAGELDKADLEQRPAVPEAAGSPPSQVSTSEGEVDDLIAQFGRDFGIYRDRLRAAAATATATTRGINGKIEVTMLPRHVTAVSVDPKWLRGARYTEIRAEALAAFQAACRQAGTGFPDTVPMPASIARIRELASDPRALSRQLGLS
jgi:hypothetical protein